MRVYLAAMYARKQEMQAKAEELRALGIEVTSRWLLETSKPGIALKEAQQELGTKGLRGIARTDIQDILRADVTALFTEDPGLPTVRGGRHFESGFAYAVSFYSNGQCKLITVGPRENIFHFLPDVQNFPTWEQAKQYLEDLRGKQREEPRQLGFPSFVPAQ